MLLDVASNSAIDKFGRCGSAFVFAWLFACSQAGLMSVCLFLVASRS